LIPSNSPSTRKPLVCFWSESPLIERANLNEDVLAKSFATFNHQPWDWPYNSGLNPLPTFPNGAHCAVSLTYDDGITSHFEDVGPTLEACGLRGTFNITIARESMMGHAPEWRAMAARGHVLGNHSLFHPCRSTAEDPKLWVGPYNLLDYDPHCQFVEWLGQNKNQIWTAPMINVVKHLKIH
jgi:hypothetical protein